VSIKTYLDTIPDEDLVTLIEDDWDNIRDFCILLTLDMELVRQDTPFYNLPN
jgi:hypothetical protein